MPRSPRVPKSEKFLWGFCGWVLESRGVGFRGYSPTTLQVPHPHVVLEGGVAFYELPADLPPSTMYTPPVQKLLSSLARNSINFATSSGSP